jgi:uncharacterized protein (DUF58 family)
MTMPGSVRRGWWQGLLFPAGPPPRRSLWLPAEGRCWLLTAALLLGLGLFKNINLLLLLGYLLLVLLVLNAAAAGRGLRRLHARRSVEEPVFAGAPFALEVHLTNTGRRAVLGVSVEDSGPDHALAWRAVRVEREGGYTFRAEVVLPRRGRCTWGPTAVACGYPFGLVRRRVEVGTAGEVVVLPRLGLVHRGRLRRHLRRAAPHGDSIRRHRPQRDPSAQAEFHGLRAWRTGDSPRNIHWRTSARRGELMVREYEDVPTDNLLLVLDATGPARGERFEAAVSLAATVCWEWCRHKGDRLIVAVADDRGGVLDGVAGPSHGRQVLERLALAETGADPDDWVLARNLAAFADVPAAAVVVSAGPTFLTDLLARALQRPAICLNAAAPEELDFYEPPLEDDKVTR